jgi:predicted TIM-barrel fold metal-dependent hydrolase
MSAPRAVADGVIDGVVDGHHHLWDLGAVVYPWLMDAKPRFFGHQATIAHDYRLADFRRDHGGIGVAGSVHIQVGAADPLAETRWLAAHAQAENWPLAIVAAADLTAATLEADLDALAAAARGRLRGIRQIVARHPSEDGADPGALLRSPAFARGLRVLAAHNLCFDLQLTAPLLLEAADLFGAVPELAVALCHCGSPWDTSAPAMARWQRDLHAFARLPSAVVKLSGLGMLRPAGDSAGLVDGVLDAFGPDRSLWGSNVPVDALHRPWRSLFADVAARVPPADQAQVFAGTSRRFYRL